MDRCGDGAAEKHSLGMDMTDKLLILTEPKVTITMMEQGMKVDIGEGFGPDELFVAAALLSRAGNQIIDMAQMQQARAQSQFADVAAGIQKERGRH